jgi:GTP-binding protein HflX
MLIDRVVRMDLSIPLSRMDLVAFLHEQGKVLKEDYERGVADVQCVVPKRFESKFKDFLVKE